MIANFMFYSSGVKVQGIPLNWKFQNIIEK